MAIARRTFRVHLDSDLLTRLDRIAVDHGVGRSELLRLLVLQLVVTHEEVDDERVAAHGNRPDSDIDLERLMRVAAETTLALSR